MGLIFLQKGFWLVDPKNSTFSIIKNMKCTDQCLAEGFKQVKDNMINLFQNILLFVYSASANDDDP